MSLTVAIIVLALLALGLLGLLAVTMAGPRQLRRQRARRRAPTGPREAGRRSAPAPGGGRRAAG